MFESRAEAQGLVLATLAKLQQDLPGSPLRWENFKVMEDGLWFESHIGHGFAQRLALIKMEHDPSTERWTLTSATGSTFERKNGTWVPSDKIIELQREDVETFLLARICYKMTPAEMLAWTVNPEEAQP